MKNRLIIIIAAMWLMTACGVLKKTGAGPASTNTTGQTTTTVTTETAPIDAIIATLGDWQTLQTGGSISLKGSTNFSSAIQVKMLRDQAIYISLRPLLGIEAGKLLITGDSLYAVDKVHKRYIAEKVSILTSGIPVTVRDVQDIFLGRPFIIGKGTLNETTKAEMAVNRDGNAIILAPNETFMGYGYAFTFDKNTRITSLDIVPAGSTVAAYQVKYCNVRSTLAGNISHTINVNANIDKKSLAFSLSYKDIDWNGKVKIDKSIPGNYKRMSARDLLSIFSN